MRGHLFEEACSHGTLSVVAGKVLFHWCVIEIQVGSRVVVGIPEGTRLGGVSSLVTGFSPISRAVTTSTGDTFYLGGVLKADRNAGRLWMQRFEEQGIEDLRDVSDEYWSAMAGSLQ